MFVFVEHDDRLSGIKVRTFGPFSTADEAEAARRRRHFANMQESPANLRWVKTYMCRIEADPS